MLRITFNNIKLDEEQKQRFSEDDYPRMVSRIKSLLAGRFFGEPPVSTNLADVRLLQQLLEKMTVAIVPDQVGKPAGFLANP